MLSKTRILKELQLQEKIQGHVDNKDLIIKIVNYCKFESEFISLCKIEFYRYGIESYKIHRFYYVKDYMLSLLNQ